MTALDHLLLLGLEDALLAAALDEESQLLGAHPPCAWSPAPSSRVTPVVIAVRTRDERPEERAARNSMEPLRRSANRSVWARARLFGHQLAEDDREQRSG